VSPLVEESEQKEAVRVRQRNWIACQSIVRRMKRRRQAKSLWQLKNLRPAAEGPFHQSRGCRRTSTSRERRGGRTRSRDGRNTGFRRKRVENHQL